MTDDIGALKARINELEARQVPEGWVAVPIQMTPEQMRAVQMQSEIGSHIASNWSGAYSCFQEFWAVALAAIKPGKKPADPQQGATMTAPTQKSLGQIAWEVDTEGYGYEWSEVEPQYKADWERIASAVAAEVRAQCLAEVRANQLPDATTDFRKGWWSAIDICEHGIEGLK